MNEDKFWKIIDLFDTTQTNSKAIMENAIQALSELEVSEIEIFAEILAEKLYALDGAKYAQSFEQPVSVDDFLYVRCFVVANGRDYYENVLQNPEQLEDNAFEPLLRLTDFAYEIKTNEAYFFYVTKLSYETYSNSKGWELEQVNA